MGSQKIHKGQRCVYTGRIPHFNVRVDELLRGGRARVTRESGGGSVVSRLVDLRPISESGVLADFDAILEQTPESLALAAIPDAAREAGCEVTRCGFTGTEITGDFSYRDNTGQMFRSAFTMPMRHAEADGMTLHESLVFFFLSLAEHHRRIPF